MKQINLTTHTRGDLASCPSCGSNHPGWKGRLISSVYLDGHGGYYNNILKFSLICPKNGESVIGVRQSEGDRSGGVIDIKLSLGEMGVE